MPVEGKIRGESMLSSQVIQASIDELRGISKIDLSVMDMQGQVIASTFDYTEPSRELLLEFADSAADSQVIGGCHLFKIFDDGEPAYLLMAKGNDDAYMIGKIAVSHMGQLLTAYREKFDRNNFFQNLLLDNLLLVDIYNRAKKLHIQADVDRAVFLIEPEGDGELMELLRSLFSPQNGDYITAVEEKNIVLVKALAGGESYNECKTIASTIVDMINSEAMINAKVAYGTIVHELKDVSKSYKEAKMALDVGKIFYAGKNVMAYNTLGIGRLIYQLPLNLCQIFIREIFGSDTLPKEIDEEILGTVQKFFENNLNISETSRQLYVHRNTLVYRIEKLQKATGLDMRVFEDALTFKIALMVSNYIQYLESTEY